MADCAQTRDLTARTLSGNAAPADEAALLAHTTACPACAESLERARKVWTLMGRLPALPASRPLDLALVTRRPTFPAWAGVAAAAALLLSIGLLMRPSTPPADSSAAAPAVESTPTEPSAEQIRTEHALETAVQDKSEARTPEATDVKPAPLPPEPKAPVAVQPTPAPVKPSTPETAKVDPVPAATPGLKPVAPGRETLPTAAVLDRVEGRVLALINGQAVPVTASFRLTDVDGLSTLGKDSQAVLAYEDGTRVVLGADTTLSRVLERKADLRRIEIQQGVVAAQVARQSGGSVLSFSTPHAEARVLGTRFSLLISAASTRLDVKEGRVKLLRKSDGASADVAADQYSMAGKGVSLTPRPIPGPKVAVREDFERGRWSPLWIQQGEPGQGVKVAVDSGALVFSVRSAATADVSPTSLPSDPATFKKPLEQMPRISSLALKKDWPRAAALETRGTFAFGAETPLRVRLNAWHSSTDAGRMVWLGLNRGVAGQGLSVERRGDSLELWIDGAKQPLWKKALPCQKEWEFLELWISKDRIALRRNGLTVAVEANPLKAKAVQVSVGMGAKADLNQDEESRLDELDVAWLTKPDFDHVSR